MGSESAILESLLCTSSPWDTLMSSQINIHIHIYGKKQILQISVFVLFYFVLIYLCGVISGILLLQEVFE